MIEKLDTRVTCLDITLVHEFDSVYGCVVLPWHFEFYILKCKNLKCKFFLIDFLDELGNFKQKNFYTSKCQILHFEMTG